MRFKVTGLRMLTRAATCGNNTLPDANLPELFSNLDGKEEDGGSQLLSGNVLVESVLYTSGRDPRSYASIRCVRAFIRRLLWSSSDRAVLLRGDAPQRKDGLTPPP